MKVRSSFVSNSSSSSFVVRRDKVTPEQIYRIRNWKSEAISYNKIMSVSKTGDSVEKLCIPEYDYEIWSIEFEDDVISFKVDMDNFDMYFLLVHVIGISENDIIFD